MELKMGKSGLSFINECKNKNKGTILEFGTFTGNSTSYIGDNWLPENGRIITIDGWKGLPKSDKAVTDNWKEGTFTGNKQEVEKNLSEYKNITMIDSWINELDSPKSYDVGMVIGANIDVDIYESTVDTLLWLDKCEWLDNEIIIRFDDWSCVIGHSYEGGVITEEIKKINDLHNKLAYYEFLEKTGYESIEVYEDGYCAVFKLKRK